MGFKHIAAAVLLSGLGLAYLDDETSRNLLSGTLDVNEWIATDQGFVGG